MTLDTNIIIAYLNDDAVVAPFLDAKKNKGETLLLPAAVEAEFLSFGKWNIEERYTMERFLEENFLFVPFDRPLVRLTARLRTSTNLKLPDASIAATALFTRTPLFTRNTRDFKKVPNLQLISI